MTSAFELSFIKKYKYLSRKYIMKTCLTTRQSTQWVAVRVVAADILVSSLDINATFDVIKNYMRIKLNNSLQLPASNIFEYSFLGIWLQAMKYFTLNNCLI